MTESQSKAKARKVGTVADVTEGSTVTRPDGSQHTVNGGTHVLDVPGTYVLDGAEVVVK